MGVCDFSCVIHSCGEQTLVTHPNCIGTHDRYDHSDDEDSHDEEGNVVGVLVCFDLPKNIICRKKAYELLKSGQATNLRIKQPEEYCWDAWDFIDAGENMGYINVLNPGFLKEKTCDDCPCQNEQDQYTLPWRTSNEQREWKPYKSNFWCMAFCRQCFDIFIESKKINATELCSDYCKSLCEANDIKVGPKFQIYEVLSNKWTWLRKLMRESPEKKYRKDNDGYVSIKFMK